MKIKDIHIAGVGGIADLRLQLHPSMNIICGPNGVGKTTILESVAHCFTVGATSVLKRHAKFESGQITANFVSADADQRVNVTFAEFEPNRQAQVSGAHLLSSHLLSLKTTRTFSYQPLQHISRDPEKQQHTLWAEAMSGVSLLDIKGWFVNRYLFSAHGGALTGEQMANFELAKQCFSLLNEDFSFEKVDASTNEIIVGSPSGGIYYEYLSSGFKSCLAILFGIIKEIEYRFTGAARNARDFSGIILIDEIDLHLHPSWQAKIQKVLLRTFPSAQFITSTHSPHVIQAAERNQIIALEQSDSGVALRQLPNSELGFKGWTVEEVLTDVMGMEDTRTTEFRELMKVFGAAIDCEDLSTAEMAYEKLDRSLHPDNPARRLFRIQINSLREFDDDKA